MSHLHTHSHTHTHTLLTHTHTTHTHAQVDAISRDWASRAALPQHVVQMVNNFPSSLHPMAQFSAAVTAMHGDSKFVKAYSEGAPKTKYWEVSGPDTS